MAQELSGTVSWWRMELGILNAVGVLFFAGDTRRHLYLLRNDKKNPGCWALPGGKVEDGESLLAALQRECQEELGMWPHQARPIPLEKFTSDNGEFVYHTFVIGVDREFVPDLNDEHMGYAWVSEGHNPKPLHPGLWSTMNMDVIQNKIRTLHELY